jgi:predicted short-subunit dehydrogenase-like oxidoreductase (DUF2520 family)
LTRRDEPLRHPWLIGPGRLGLALARRFVDTGTVERLTVGGRSATAPPDPIFDHPGIEYRPLSARPPVPSLVLLAVPDREIEGVASALAGRSLPPVPVLHTSGVLSVDALAALARRGHPVGSLHPLAAIADPASGASRLEGAWFAVEGDPAGMAAALRIVEMLKGSPLRVEATGKPGYHAAAVFASNYVVVLLDVAERLMVEAGVVRADARTALGELALGAVSNALAASPVNALTGPISRGDSGTVRYHLRGLSAEDRALYSELARATLDLARRQGLDPEGADRVARTLEQESP